jgi:general stress protein YciG
MATEPKGKPRGFSTLDLEKHRQIASKGGKAAHAQGRAHEFTSEEAKAAGRKGGAIVSADRGHMARIGQMGGRARKGPRRPKGDEVHALAAAVAPLVDTATSLPDDGEE